MYTRRRQMVSRFWNDAKSPTNRRQKCVYITSTVVGQLIFYIFPIIRPIEFSEQISWSTNTSPQSIASSEQHKLYYGKRHIIMIKNFYHILNDIIYQYQQ